MSARSCSIWLARNWIALSGQGNSSTIASRPRTSSLAAKATSSSATWRSTFMTGEAAIERCSDNLNDGHRPILVTRQRGLTVAEALAENVGLGHRIDIFEIEQFIALNLYEMGKFVMAGRRAVLKDFVTRYNEIIDEVETDPSLKSNLGSRFLLRASRPRGIRNRQSRPDTGTPSRPPNIGDQAIWPPAWAATSHTRCTWAAMQEPVCGPQLKMGRAAASRRRASRHAGPTVPQKLDIGFD